MTRIIFSLLVAASLSMAADAKAGKAVYGKACKSCHGADGKPNPGVAKMMKVAMKHLGDASVQSLADDKWTDVITQGTGKMKPIKSLTAAQADDVIAFCRTLKK